MNHKYKVGDLVRFKKVESVPPELYGSVALISQILTEPKIDYHLSYDKTKPIYVLYVNDGCKNLYWEEAEFELAKERSQ
jgi:hypothetical protein